MFTRSLALFKARRLAVLVGVAAVAYFAGQLGQVSQTFRRQMARRSAGVPTTCVQKGMIAMTFDGGISKALTPLVLDALKTANVKATFHISTEWISDPLVKAILGRIISDGHTLGVAWRGPSPLTLKESEIRGVLVNISTEVKNNVGVSPKFIRLPWGNSNLTVENLVASQGLVMSSWSIDAGDTLNCNDIAALVNKGVASYDKQLSEYKNAGNLTGSFISLHTDLCQIATEVTKVISLARDTYGYRFVPLEECLGSPGKYLDTPGVPQPPPSSNSVPSNSGSVLTSPGASNNAPSATSTVGNNQASTMTSKNTPTGNSTPASLSPASGAQKSYKIATIASILAAVLPLLLITRLL